MPRNPRTPVTSLLLVAGLQLAVISLDANSLDAAEGDDLFEKKVRPILVERCHKCHVGPSPKGGLRLDSRDGLLRGGESGPAAVIGKPDESLLIQAARHQNGLAMPPDGKLSESQIADLATWIKSGANWPGAAAATRGAALAGCRAVR